VQNSKLTVTLRSMIRYDQILRWTGWIKRTVVKIAVGVCGTVAYDNVHSVHVNFHLNSLIIIKFRTITWPNEC